MKESDTRTHSGGGGSELDKRVGYTFGMGPTNLPLPGEEVELEED